MVELDGIMQEVVGFERRLVMKQQLVHIPELVLECGRLSGDRCGEGVRMDFSHRKVPEGEAETLAHPSLHAFDLPVRFARVRALVVAVLDDHTTRWGPRT